MAGKAVVPYWRGGRAVAIFTPSRAKVAIAKLGSGWSGFAGFGDPSANPGSAGT
jgi:hypothetical protein